MIKSSSYNLSKITRIIVCAFLGSVLHPVTIALKRIKQQYKSSKNEGSTILGASIEAYGRILIEIFYFPSYISEGFAKGIRFGASKSIKSFIVQIFEAQRFSENTNMRKLEYLKLASELADSIKNNELSLYYEPIFDLNHHEMQGVEASMRWNHPERGIISFEDLLMIAEIAGLRILIEEWMLEQACRHLSFWKKEKIVQSSLIIVIYLSNEHFEKKSILAIIDYALNNLQVNPGSLELIISGTFGLDKNAFLLINEISKRGVGFCLDEIGNGSVKLSDLKLFKSLRIHRSLLTDTNQNNTEKFISSLFSMASVFNIKTFAKDIESKKELEFFRSKNCDYFQGPYFSKPVHSEKLKRILMEQTNKT